MKQLGDSHELNFFLPLPNLEEARLRAEQEAKDREEREKEEQEERRKLVEQVQKPIISVASTLKKVLFKTHIQTFQSLCNVQVPLNLCS